MVQYIFTPWKDQSELLWVRRQFFPQHVSPTNTTTEVASSSCYRADKKSAVSRVSMWMQRGGCPHIIESTALLIAAMIADEESMLLLPGKDATDSNSSYAVRASYSAAFSRFVTGLLDSHQDKAHKMSMYSVAKNIGLPATFVELRHQATHEQLPSMTRLRSGAQAGLVWIWDYYWKQLSDTDDNYDQISVVAVGGGDAAEASDSSDTACRYVLRNYLDMGKENLPGLCTLVRRWGRIKVLSVLDAICDEAGTSFPMDNRLVLRTLKLARQVTEMDQAPDDGGTLDSVGSPGALEKQASWEMQPLGDDGMAKVCEDGKKADGWSRPKGLWRPQPIGVV